MIKYHDPVTVREQLAFDMSYDPASDKSPSSLETVFSPSEAGFRAGSSEPLHNWYPLLEGYSPQYVRYVLQRYAPTARTVLDPFAGSGTTPLTASFTGRTAYYAEVNPLLQFLIDKKAKVLSSNSRRRIALAEGIERLSTEFHRHAESYPECQELLESYRVVFTGSQFFNETALSQILQTRSFIDNINCTDPFLGDLVTIAVLAALVPSSLLIRAGDLRYKTETEAERKQPNFLDEVVSRLMLIGSDLRRVCDLSAPNVPRLIAEDARHLCRLPRLRVDAIVTSPPYLNGTNYFRNTKIELWFLRCLRTTADLAFYRSKAIMSGINDVSSRRVLSAAHHRLLPLLHDLSNSAYDQRIPKMVHGYFADMSVVIAGLVDHLSSDGTLAIDIGDSSYAGVHVPTDDIIADIVMDLGLHLDDKVMLRSRMSRGGSALRQTLLVFKTTKPRPVDRPALRPWDPRWTEFKRTLPHQTHPYVKRNWGHPLHSLCSYQGKLKPALAAHLVAALVPEHGSVLDPFAGVATIPFEAALSGRKAYGFDISPAAVVIGTGKLGRAQWPACQQVLRELATAIHDGVVQETERTEAETFGLNGRLVEYFHERTLQEIIVARRYFMQHWPSDAPSALVMSSLLHILHGNRPYSLSRRSHPITPFAPTGALEYRALLPRLVAKVVRSLKGGYPDAFVDGEMLFQDATSWWPKHICELDAIVTSPPFFDSTRFHAANWMRLWFAGWSPDDFRSRPLYFVDERQKHDFSVYEPVFRQARERLKDGGVMVLHLGKSYKCDMARELAHVARPWFREVDLFTESVEHCESHGITDKGTVGEHQYLVLN